MRKLLLLLWLSISMSGEAQILSMLNDYIHQSRVGLVDEFIDRFNGDAVHPDMKSSDGSRLNNLFMLCDLSEFKSLTDQRFLQADSMMRVVVDENVKLHYSDSTWFALAHCKGKLDGKAVGFDLYLQVESYGDDMFKWVMTRAEGEVFDAAPKFKNDRIMLSPDDHETNFMSLHRLTSEQPGNIGLFMKKGFDYDTTSAFIYLVHSGRLKIDYVDQLEFVFTQVPGYIFHVSYFDRDSSNAGWLISDISHADDHMKFFMLNGTINKSNTLVNK